MPHQPSSDLPPIDLPPGMPAGRDGWPTAMATVVECRFDAGVGRAMLFGLPPSRRFRVTYNYFAGDQLHTSTMRLDKPLPQGTLFPVRYDPAEAAQHTSAHTAAGGARRLPPALVFGAVLLAALLLAGPLVLAWLHGCG